ncbi:MAG: RNA polymerase sigma factor FliA [Gallionellales bacterium CG_4_10_14_3_um_filter_54_96]|nr:MAG: RNA polymerase sigma factor FliA [Gallionellaceae bacterium CG1_02_56_997]PIV15197.1 MAG: RNA polymerase sigma factor FliA [Gallionellales bacterium CG03_land_8_20_14_0_80_55_15]PIX04642.1 MAG: RNA polymerase sigma factor FliA [Gallionellales bacterium CG_4_8_14_3_um_filter_54_18]PIY04692.1 MAG: RNA polymerase sigma factor FliA [Gallionellales bacterium CG_4_10_14_3_um_filter_54_96]PJC03388.1 MAG: RNA polymerase sigma factor FliA [Gallionellales bacterium CG_4_9_14_0_8_um_filter_55_61]
MYNASGLKNKDQCLRDYAPLVKRIAHQMMTKLPYSVQIDDIIQAGMIGLLDAASRYDEIHGAQFETYATQRIRGAMLDELRSADWLPRSLRRDMRKIEQAISRMQQKLGRAPNEAEIAEEMRIPLEEYQQMLQESRGAQLVYYEDFQDEDHNDFFERFEFSDDADPLALLQDDRFKAELMRAIEKLPERERQLMGMIYEQEMNLREVGEVFGVSESRISQLHSQAVARLRGWLKGY